MILKSKTRYKTDNKSVLLIVFLLKKYMHTGDVILNCVYVFGTLSISRILFTVLIFHNNNTSKYGDLNKI